MSITCITCITCTMRLQASYSVQHTQKSTSKFAARQQNSHGHDLFMNTDQSKNDRIATLQLQLQYLCESVSVRRLRRFILTQSGISNLNAVGNEAEKPRCMLIGRSCDHFCTRTRCTSANSSDSGTGSRTTGTHTTGN